MCSLRGNGSAGGAAGSRGEDAHVPGASRHGPHARPASVMIFLRKRGVIPPDCTCSACQAGRRFTEAGPASVNVRDKEEEEEEEEGGGGGGGGGGIQS